MEDYNGVKVLHWVTVDQNSILRKSLYTQSLEGTYPQHSGRDESLQRGCSVCGTEHHHGRGTVRWYSSTYMDTVRNSCLLEIIL